MTEPELVTLLQAGAHHVRGALPFQDQAGAGELDVEGALTALDETTTPREGVPAADASWLSLASDYAPADGKRAVTALLELRTAGGVDRADQFDASRLAGTASLASAPLSAPSLTRLGPGLWSMSIAVPAGFGGETLTVGATFDGVPVVHSLAVPVATDVWTAHGAVEGKGGGCLVAAGDDAGGLRAPLSAAVGLLFVLGRRARRRRQASLTASPPTSPAPPTPA